MTLRTRVAEWSAKLGLLPIPLHVDDDYTKVIMMNGSSGNFCFSAGKTLDPQRLRADAWSSNVGHYVSVSRDVVSVLRYDMPQTAERYSLRSVESDLEQFHTYLEKSQPKENSSVIAHAVRVFRQVRSACEVQDGRAPLSAFLAILAQAADESEGKQFDPKQWNLPTAFEEACSSIQSADREMLLAELLSKAASNSLRLFPQLLLRHAAGQLFQEAHYESVVAQQMRFAGFSLPPAQTSAATTSIGVHFTPPSLARTVVEQSLRHVDTTHQKLVVFDPACGSGEFLRESLRQLRTKGYEGHVHLIGYDISDTACDMAKFILSWEKRVDAHLLTFEISSLDSLTTQWPSDVDLLLMNPPFLSYEEINSFQRESLRKDMGSLAKGRFDLSTAFVWKAAHSLKTNAVLAAITPASFLESHAAHSVREDLSSILDLRLVARLGNQTLFSNALVDASAFVSVIGKHPHHETTAFWADYRSNSTSSGLRALRRCTGEVTAPVLGSGFSIYGVKDLEVSFETWAPRAYESRELLLKLATLPRVSQLFSVRLGARPGVLKAFAINKLTYSNLPTREQPFFRPAVMNSSISDGCLNDSFYVFYPYGDAHLENEKALQLAVPTYFRDFLKPLEANLRNRKSKRAPERWWEMSEPISTQIPHAPKIVSVEFGDAGSFSYDHRGDFVVVRGCFWLPKGRLIKTFSTSERVAKAYVALLNSTLMSSLLASISNQVQGGQWNLSARYVDRLPIPDLSETTGGTIINDLAKIGGMMISGVDWDSEALADASRAAYGLRN